MAIPSPEQLQYILGIHPDQQAAAIAAVQQDNSNLQPNGEPKPLPNGGKYDRQPITQPPLLRTGPTPRGLDVPKVGETEEKPEEPAPFLGAFPPSPKPTPPAPDQADTSSLNSLMTQPIRPISGDQDRENKDRTELDRLQSTGSGISQFGKRHHILGPILRGLDIAGQVLVPGVEEAIPGTEGHHRELMGEAQGRIGKDIEAEKAHSQMATSEEAQQARQEANRIREEGMQGKLDQANAKFVAGSEHEDPNSPTGYTAQTVGGEWKPFTPPASYKQTKGESFEEVQRRREAEADRQGLTGKDRKYYIANGKLSEPGVHISNPSAALEELHDWEAAFEHEHGRKPNAQEISDFKHGARGGSANAKTFKDSAAIDKYSNDWFTKQRKAVLDEKAKVHSLNPDAATDDKALQAEYKRIEDEYATRAAEFERQKKNWYAQVNGGRPVTIEDSGEGVPATTGEEPIPRPVTGVRTGPILPPGSSVTSDTGEPMQPVITGRDAKGRPTIGAKPSPGTPAAPPKPPQPGTKLDPTNEEHKKIALAYVKAAGGNKAKARQLAQRDGWSF